MPRRSLVGALAALALVAFAPSVSLAAEEHCRDSRGGSAVLDWGINGSEQLASGFASGYENAPQPVAGLTGVTQVRAGYRWALALLGDCTLRSWGGNDYGQLGSGSQQPQAHPVRVPGLSEVKEIAVGNAHGMALRFDGTVWTWGAAELGERGNRERGFERQARQNEPWFVARDRPAQVPGLTGVVQIAAGGGRDYALLSDGEVEAWGEDHAGQLGVEEPAGEEELCFGETHAITPAQCSTVPRAVKVAGLGVLSGVERIAAGEEDAYAIRDGGEEVLAWGAGGRGQLGDGGTQNSASPVRVAFAPPAPVREIAAGAQQVLARLADGEVYAWGGDGSGQLGFEAGGEATESCGREHPCSMLPLPVVGLEHVSSVAAGEVTSFALTEEEGGAEVAYSFGSSGFFELLGLGRPGLLETSTPTPIEGLGQAGQVSVSGTSAVLLLQGGRSRSSALAASAASESLTLTWQPTGESYRLRYRPVGTREFSRPLEGSCRSECSLSIAGLRPQPYEVSLRTPEGREGKEKLRRVIATPLAGRGWPSNTARPTVSGSPALETGDLRAGQTLEASPGSWSESPEFTYDWLRCAGLGEAGSEEELGTECEAVGSGRTYVVAPADVGQSIIVRVEARDGSGTSAATSQPELVLGSGEEELPPYPRPLTPPTLSGVAVEGEPLTAHEGSWEGLPTERAFHWLRCRGRNGEGAGAGCSAITHRNEKGQSEPVSGETYLAGPEDLEKYVEVQERAANPGGYELATSRAVQVAPDAVPENTAAPQIAGTAEQGQLLGVQTGSWNHAALNPRWQWLRCDAGGGGCANIAGATASGYTVTPADVGHSLEVAEGTENGVGQSALAYSGPTEAVPPPPGSAPEALAPPLVGGIAEQGRTLTAQPADWGGEVKSTARQWKRCEPPAENCRAIAGATGATYVPSADDVGKTLLVRETATNAAGTAVSQSTATSTVVGAVPVATSAPAVRGMPRQGRELSELRAGWTNEPLSFAYRWLRCEASGEGCHPIEGASSRSYEPTAADVGKRLRVEETARNATGAGEGSLSAATATVLPSPPVEVAAPGVVGIGAEGETLTARQGTWLGLPSSFSYQWLRCEDSECLPIEGATHATYRLLAADVGFAVEVREAARNAGGWQAADSEGLPVGGAPVPYVSSIAPASGPGEGGTPVLISGGNFQEASGVQFGFAAASFEILSPGRIRALAPAGSPGDVDVTVTSPDGTSALTAGDRFSYGIPPSVSGIEPVEGPEGGGTVVTIHGANLSETLAVRFGAGEAKSFGVLSASTITAESPPGTGRVGITVLTPFGSTTAAGPEQYTYLHTGDAPVVSGLSLKKGPAAGGTTLTITGSHFTGATQVSFGSLAGPASFEVDSDTTITATSPPGPSGTVQVQVSNEFGTSAAGGKDHYKYEGPTITRVSPSSGPLAGGTQVTVTGTGFVPGEHASAFRFGKADASFVECASTGECQMIAPPGAKRASIDIRAVSGAAKSAKTPADRFTYE